jgi:hypothetical protein
MNITSKHIMHIKRFQNASKEHEPVLAWKRFHPERSLTQSALGMASREGSHMGGGDASLDLAVQRELTDKAAQHDIT